jgi:hypothetical protein
LASVVGAAVVSGAAVVAGAAVVSGAAVSVSDELHPVATIAATSSIQRVRVVRERIT